MTEHMVCTPSLAEEQDVPQLKALWKTVFGDDDDDIDQFFSTWFSPALTIVMRDGTKPVAAAYILPVGQLVLRDEHGHEGTRLDCAMVYAIATLPVYRGNGYGEMVTRAAAELAAKTGYPAVVLKPADDGLFTFYTERSAFREFFGAFVSTFTDTDLTPLDPYYSLAPVSPLEYRQLRQKLLEDATFIDMDERGLSYQLYLSARSGGGLYALQRDGQCVGCAVIEPEDGIVQVKELHLVDTCRMIDAVSAIAQVIPSEKYTVRSLAAYGTLEKGGYHRFGMIATVTGHPDISSVHTAKWYGLAFD